MNTPYAPLKYAGGALTAAWHTQHTPASSRHHHVEATRHAWRTAYNKAGLLIAALLLCFPLAALADEATAPFTLDAAIARAEAAHPELARLAHEANAAQADAAQAGRWPNPEIELRAEGITGQTAADRPDQEQRIAGIAQAIPISGRTAKARAAATLGAQRAEADLDAERIALRARVKAAFAEVLHRQDRARQLGELAAMLKGVEDLAAARVREGDLAEGDLIQAQANTARFTLRQQDAAAALQSARATLAEAIGAPSETVPECAGALPPPDATPDWPALEAALESQPRTRVADLDVQRAAAEMRAERAKRVPEPELSVAYRGYRATDQDTLDLGLRFAVPLFDRNRDAVRAAREREAAAEAARTRDRNAALAAFKRARAAFESAQARARTLGVEVLPRTAESLKIAEQRFKEGDIAMFELLEAHRVHAESRLEHLDALADRNAAAARIEELCGPPTAPK